MLWDSILPACLQRKGPTKRTFPATTTPWAEATGRRVTPPSTGGGVGTGALGRVSEATDGKSSRKRPRRCHWPQPWRRSLKAVFTKTVFAALASSCCHRGRQCARSSEPALESLRVSVIGAVFHCSAGVSLDHNPFEPHPQEGADKRRVGANCSGLFLHTVQICNLASTCRAFGPAFRGELKECVVGDGNVKDN